MTESNMNVSVKVIRDAGYNKKKLLSPGYRKKVRERVKDPNIVTGNYKLKELFAEIGIIVNPEKMTNWYMYGE